MVDVVSITALVISVVALVTTILQVLQQYFGSAEGYRRCAESVMGKWSRETHRKFRGSELRFEVLFVTPVIFLAPPTNDKGPIPGQKIQYIDGTDESYKNTWTTKSQELKQQTLDNTKRVHTADDERASWVTILSTLQDLESESNAWEKKNRNEKPPRRKYEQPVHTLSVGLQRKTRSWDFMPAAVFKPFATTTICHLVEMATILGMYWKTFDQKTWHMRAEGNGLILTSTLVHGLGIMVTFSKTGASKFTANRIIPADEVKVIAFGSVPSIFTKKSSLEFLTFGDQYEVNSTLELLGCTTDVIGKYEKKHRHLFSVAFEIIGMLAAPVRIRGSNFKMLPNPTGDHFFPASFSRCKLMMQFQTKLTEYLTHLQNTSNSTPSTDSDLTYADKVNPSTFQLMAISEQWKAMQLFWPKDNSENLDANIDINLRESIHDALDKSTAYLLSQPLDYVCSVVSSHITAVIDSLNSTDTPLQGLSGRKSVEHKLISIYFTEIREKVVASKNNGNMGEEDEDVSGTGVPEADEEIVAQRNAIWCTLIFRMVGWLLLHDFDKADVKIAPSDLKGSRMPVFIG